MFNHVNFSFGHKSDSVPATVSLTAAESVPPSTVNAASAPLTPRLEVTSPNVMRNRLYEREN